MKPKKLTGPKIRAIRKSMDMSAKEFAQGCLHHKSHTYLLEVENERKPIPENWLEKHVFRTRGYTEV